MNLFEIIFISFGLALSVFPITVSGALESCISSSRTIVISLLYGIFMGGLMAFGYWLCTLFNHLLNDFRYWIVAGIFLILGIKMIFGSLKSKIADRQFHMNNDLILFFSAIAANINGFIAGLAFAFMKINFAQLVLIITLLTTLVALTGLYYGKKAGSFSIAKKAELTGGLILTGYSIFLLISYTNINYQY